MPQKSKDHCHVQDSASTQYCLEQSTVYQAVPSWLFLGSNEKSHCHVLTSSKRWVKSYLHTNHRKYNHEYQLHEDVFEHTRTKKIPTVSTIWKVVTRGDDDNSLVKKGPKPTVNCGYLCLVTQQVGSLGEVALIIWKQQCWQAFWIPNMTIFVSKMHG